MLGHAKIVIATPHGNFIFGIRRMGDWKFCGQAVDVVEATEQ